MRRTISSRCCPVAHQVVAIGWRAIFWVGVYAVAGWSGAPGTVGGHYLHLEPCARIVGMGGACMAVGGDPWSITVNPAGLVACARPTLAATQMTMLAGVRFVTLAYAQPLPDAGVIGAGAMYLYSTEDAYAVTGDRLGEFLNVGASASLGYARPVAADCDAGVALKAAYVALGGAYRADGFALDVGIRYRPRPDLIVACAWGTLPLGFGLTEHRETMSSLLRIGAAKTFAEGRFLIAADTSISPEGASAVLAGVEYRFPLANARSCVVRSGVRWHDAGGAFGQVVSASVGAGIRSGAFIFEYSFSPYAALQDNTHYFSLGWER